MQQTKEGSPRRDRSPLLHPSKPALQFAAQIHQATLNQKESAPVRFSFIDSRDQDIPPPMTRILRGGRSGVVRLKLHLTLLWFGNPAKPLTYPALAWATLLDLSEPETNGARRITSAFQWLARNRFISLDSRQGHPPRVRLLQEDGTGVAYTVPWSARREAKRKQDAKAVKDKHLYVKLKSAFWTNGWIDVLSGPAIAMLLILLRLAGENQKKPVWISPSEAASRFGLSEDTRTSGFRELAAYGLLSITRRSVDPHTFDWRRVRNVYRLNPTGFDSAPGQVLASSDLEPESE